MVDRKPKVLPSHEPFFRRRPDPGGQGSRTWPSTGPEAPHHDAAIDRLSIMPLLTLNHLLRPFLTCLVHRAWSVDRIAGKTVAWQEFLSRVHLEGFVYG
jgi:hypothetical protein